MKNTAQNDSILIVTGMHRSGTSLVASILQSAGLYLGNNLMPATQDNPHGYFENLEFVSFHREILESQALSSDGWVSTGSVPVPLAFHDRAEDLIDDNRLTGAKVWGWKDPRSVIFLKFWADLLPSAKFLFVHRPPWEVVDSLYRRGDIVFRKNPILALNVWQNFSELVLDFCKSNPQRSILFDIDSVIQTPDTFIDKVKIKFGFDLKTPEKQFDSTLFHKHSPLSYQALVIKAFFSNSYETWQQLRIESAIQPDTRARDEGDEAVQEKLAEAILQNWSDLGHAQLLLKKHLASDLSDAAEQTGDLLSAPNAAHDLEHEFEAIQLSDLNGPVIQQLLN